ncbi:MAG: aldehyde dehydrogenase [Gammaproteobacteria bacterium]|nr:aldehyde dehydrogenase [Gammaproteobacteria bacterium]
MSNLTHSQWQTLAEQLTINGRAYINGEYTNAVSGETFDCINPANGKLLAKVARCNSDDAKIAIDTAKQVFESGVWSKMAPVKRKKILQTFASLMQQHQQELALLETLDMGKPISESASVDVPGAINCINWYAEAIDKVYDEVAPTSDNEIALITREAVGVVAAVVPWNFPLLMGSWKFAPALATGNSVILKPSEKSPLTAIRIAELAEQAGIPKGVFQVLPGFGHEVGEALALSNDVDCLVFTGSTGVGKRLLQYSGQSNMKRVWIEAGGKSPNIIFADCIDLKKAAEAAAWGCFYNQGEVCVAGTRLLIESSIKEAFMPLLVDAIKALQPGDPLDPATNMGAIVDDVQMNQVLKYINIGHEQGGKLITGGEQVNQDTGGYYIAPTIFDDVDNQMRLAREEIFGPVMAVITFDTQDQAIAIANDSPFGLAAGIWTANLNKAHKMAKALRAGSVWVNNYNGGDMTVPFGGFKQSGNARDKSLHAIDKYTEIKTTLIQLED